MSLPTLEGSSLSPLEYYSVIRSRIEHEDSLVVQRLSWLVASQSFLFTADAIVTNGLATQPVLQPGGARFLTQLQLLYQLIPVVGMLTSALIYVSILAAITAMRHLRNSYHSRFPDDEKGPPSIMTRAPVRLFGHSAAVLLPLVFITIWLVLWMHGLV
ncbi:MAG TPA: hypothetical protein VMP11_15170 [Verrucomicrobiae bacterium]|nr:hypothetical protein [Verrucomicrobiae bacterium]